MVIEQDSIFSLETGPDIILREGQIDIFENYPNPFNHSTTFRYSISNPGKSELTLYTVTGQQVSQIINDYSMVGNHQMKWSSGDLSSGLYIAKLVHNNDIKTKKILLVK